MLFSCVFLVLAVLNIYACYRYKFIDNVIIGLLFDELLNLKLSKWF